MHGTSSVRDGLSVAASSDYPAQQCGLLSMIAARRRIRLLEQENEVLRRAAAYLSQANLPKK